MHCCHFWSVFPHALRSWIACNGNSWKSRQTSIGKGEVIAAGVNAPLDEVRNLAFHSQEALDAIRDREAKPRASAD